MSDESAPSRSEARRTRAARELFSGLAPALGLNISVSLWDGSRVPLGGDLETKLAISIASPGVLGSLLRRPTLENLVRQYALGGIALEGGDILEFVDALTEKPDHRQKVGAGDIVRLARTAFPLLLARHSTQALAHGFSGETTGRRQGQRSNKDFIQFHYDLSNDFYALFLDPEMQYSCGYFTDWSNTLEQCQLDKLEMICRKLRLAPGQRLLDIGCGWGGLICYAAQHYGVSAHGVTLSQRQHDFAVEKIERLGLTDQVRVELIDYTEVDGCYDKISSIGMFEHIGRRNFTIYWGTIWRLLRDRGVVLNHGIASRAKPTRRRARRISPEKKLLHKYIFPGSELASIGHTLATMEHVGFEIHDVEGLREHYALTARAWCERLSRRRDEAIAAVGPERYRLWLAYLAGVSRGFHNGSMLIFQAVATKHQGHGPSGMPPTRHHLYTEKEGEVQIGGAPRYTSSAA